MYTIRSGAIRWQVPAFLSNDNSMYTIRSGAIRWQVPAFLSNDNSMYAIRWQVPAFLSNDYSNAFIFRADTCQNSELKSLTLKIYVNITWTKDSICVVR